MRSRPSFLHQLRTAARVALLEQLRNRLALALLAAFAPLWYIVVTAFFDGRRVAFRSRVTHSILEVGGHQLTLLTAGLDVITLVVGFMMFTAARRAVGFDRRLVLSGFSRGALLGARLVTLAVVATAVSGYVVAILIGYWQPRDPVVVWLGFLEAGVAYGALGILLGVIARRELEGFFVIIMLSLIDTFIQNPIGNPSASKGVVEAFPAFAPTQVAVAGGFTDRFPAFHLIFGLAWPVGFAALAILLFGWHMRVRAVRTHTMASGIEAAPRRHLSPGPGGSEGQHLISVTVTEPPGASASCVPVTRPAPVDPHAQASGGPIRHDVHVAARRPSAWLGAGRSGGPLE